MHLSAVKQLSKSLSYLKRDIYFSLIISYTTLMWHFFTYLNTPPHTPALSNLPHQFLTLYLFFIFLLFLTQSCSPGAVSLLADLTSMRFPFYFNSSDFVTIYTYIWHEQHVLWRVGLVVVVSSACCVVLCSV